ILEGSDGVHVASHTTWVLRGVTSHDRYVAAEERTALAAHRAPLGRPSATAAALIPIRKKSVWWELPQDERRAIFEERSHHIARSLTYLPQIARRLHHGRDLLEPFDFLTWFEFAPRDMAAFDELRRHNALTYVVVRLSAATRQRMTFRVQVLAPLGGRSSNSAASASSTSSRDARPFPMFCLRAGSASDGLLPRLCRGFHPDRRTKLPQGEDLPRIRPAAELGFADAWLMLRRKQH